LRFRLTKIWMNLNLYKLYLFMFLRDVFMEKHWKSVISRSVCDYFFEEQKKMASPLDDTMPPVISTPHHYLINIFRCNLHFVAVCTTEGIFHL